MDSVKITKRKTKDIMTQATKLMEEVATYSKSANAYTIGTTLGPKYPLLSGFPGKVEEAQFFMIYRAIVARQITKKDLGMLKYMLKQSEQLSNKKTTIEKSSYEVRDALCEKMGIKQVKKGDKQ